MNKRFAIALLILFSVCSLQAQNSDEILREIKKEVGKKLRKLVENFNGTYLGELTITSLDEMDDDDGFICKGRVSYKGSLCGEVRADYKAFIYEDGTIKVCINTPICNIFGGLMYYEWDCKGEPLTTDLRKYFKYIESLD